MPRKVFTAGEILTAADVNTNLMDQAVMVFDDSAARTAAIPSPSEGMVTYLKDEDEVTVFDGSVFKAVGPGKILQVVSNFTDTITTTTNTTFQDTALSASITPSATSSKVLVMIQAASLTHTHSSGTTEYTAFRGNAATGTKLDVETVMLFGTNASSLRIPGILVRLDTPATTSATTYTAAVRTNNALNTAGVRDEQNIILMEVAG